MSHRSLTGAVDIVSISMNAATAEKYEAVCRPAFGRETYAGILEFARCCVPCVEKVVFTVVETTLPDEDIGPCRPPPSRSAHPSAFARWTRERRRAKF